jgi:hypothetical protein
MDDFSTWFGPCDFQPEFWDNLQASENLQNEGVSLHNPDVSSTVELMSTSSDTPASSNDHSDHFADSPQAKKRRQASSPCESEALVRFRKTRKLRAPQETAKIRERGACYLCQLKRKEVALTLTLLALLAYFELTLRKQCQDGVDPEGSCRRCLDRLESIVIVPGLLSPVCWRPNIGHVENFRRGPTIDLAASLRGHRVDEGPFRQALWKHFATKTIGKGSQKVVELSQNWISNTLTIPLDRYQPKVGDKQYYSWFENDVEQHYSTPAYGIANLHVARSAIEKFLEENSAGYIEGHMRNATEITRQSFQTAKEHKVGSAC